MQATADLLPLPTLPRLRELPRRWLASLLGEHDRVLSERELRLVGAIAEALIPAGRIVERGGERTARAVDQFLREAEPEVAVGYRAMLLAFEAASLAFTRRPFASLDEAARLALLERLRERAPFPVRFALRTALALVKIAHFEDAGYYHRVGCTFTAPVAAEARPRFMTERVHAASDLAGETLECDVVVIGTGAGGAVAARELAERGLAVVMVEEGRYHARSEFTRRASAMHRLMYRDLVSSTTIGNTAILVPTGRTVGGTTTINSGTCYRAPARVFRKWREQDGLVEFTPDSMAPYYERVERVLGVAPAAHAFLGGSAHVIARGADRLGLAHRPLLRNAPDCDGKGVCCYGCPTDAKRSTNVSYVPLALRAGAQVVTEARAERILVEDGRAAGVEAAIVDGETRKKITVRAKTVVVACGALLTPVLLLQNGLANRSGQLGRNLSIHPAVGLGATFDESVRGWDGIPQSHVIESFQEEGVLPIGAYLPVELAAGALPLSGPRLTALLDDFDRFAFYGAMIEDTSRGRVRPGPGGRPLLTYHMNDTDVRRLQRGVEIVSRVFFAAGARRVLPLVHGFDELGSLADVDRLAAARLTPRDFDITAYHPLGTARMGVDPDRSVVGPDHQAHDVPGLYVIDGSAVPSSLAVNPQLTIMALATRAADRLADRLG